jgi:hypothetical protein
MIARQPQLPWSGARVRRERVLKLMARVGLIPAPIQPLGRNAKLDHEVGRKVRRLDFPTFLAPEPTQGGLIIAHDDPGVRAADEIPPLPLFCFCENRLILPSSPVLADDRCPVPYRVWMEGPQDDKGDPGEKGEKGDER